MTLETIAQDMKDNPPIVITKSADADPRECEKFFKHECVYTRKEAPVTGASGGTYTYSFTPTTLGTVIHLSCACGKKEDVTDYRMW